MNEKEICVLSPGLSLIFPLNEAMCEYKVIPAESFAGLGGNWVDLPAGYTFGLSVGVV